MHKALSSYVVHRLTSSRPVVVAPYEPDARGVLVPVLPAECPERSPGGEACLVRVDHWRERKTGPEFPLMVARCAVHRVAFTVYPPGHFPYGRRALAPCTTTGAEPSAPDRDWFDTVFAGANDAAGRVPWPRESKGGSERWWSTQGRLVERALALTGTHPDLADELRHRVAETLRVPALVLREQAARSRAAPGYASRGHAVAAVLGRLVGPVVRRLLVVGHLVGLWGRPLWCDGAMRPIAAFSTSGTDPPPAAPTGRSDPRK